MKRFITFVTVILIALSLAACTTPQGTTPQGTTPQGTTPQGTTPQGTEQHAGAQFMIASPVYPEMTEYPDEQSFIDQTTGSYDDAGFSAAYDAWWADWRAQLDQPEGYRDGFDDYAAVSMAQFLTGAGAENRVYSPLNVYMALAMLAEVTDGESRAQILSLVNADDIDELRAQATALWNANYCADGLTTSVLASSLWLRKDITYEQAAMDALAEYYHASSYSGDMGSEEFDKALQGWLNEQTGGLLGEQAEGIKLDPQTVMAIAATVYFRAQWNDKFQEDRTVERTFHMADGTDIDCDFMHMDGMRGYCRGEGFSATSIGFESRGRMWLVLPDEGVSVDELLAGGEPARLMLEGDNWQDTEYLVVKLAVPKFDVVSDMDLIGGLKSLGINDVFDYTVSDFSPMTKDVDEIYVSQVKHAARVTIDEDGCTAAAYTVMMMEAGSAMVTDEIDFVLDRPFIFGITGADGSLLFVGVVNDPA